MHLEVIKMGGTMKKIIKNIMAIGMMVILSIPTYASDQSVESTTLGKSEHVRWESNTVGSWFSVDDAKEYQVKLYKADFVSRDEENLQDFDWDDAEEQVVMVQRTTAQRMNFTEYMKDGYTYFFAVRAVPKLNEQATVTVGAWVASPDVSFKDQQVIGYTGGTWRYFSAGTMYETADGTFLGGGWNLIVGEWYLFDESGYRLTGARYLDGKSYYLDEDGVLQMGWLQFGDNWYYADQDGVLQANCWVEHLPGQFYYLGSDGRWIPEYEYIE